MGTITSGVGLVSGINTGQLINSLLAIDAQPVTNLQNQVSTYTSEKSAYQDINSSLLNLKGSADSLSNPSAFNATTATSSDPSTLSATSTTYASPGTYNFAVARLVTTQQVITNGFADQSTTPVGAGTLTFESGAARLDSETTLAQLNGGTGVNRGKIRITDRSGNSAVVDLGTAVSVDDVVNAINNTSGINVTASISGDRLKIVDNTGLSTGTLGVANVGNTNTAGGLGLTVAASGGTLLGAQINTVGTGTQLTSLNDGDGVRFTAGQAAFQVTKQDGTSFSVTLKSSDTTLGSVIQEINSASGGNVTASINPAGTGLQLVDTSTPGGTLTVAALNGSNAAQDLGILGSANSGSSTILGGRLIAGIDSKLIKNLKGGSGVTLGQIGITNRAGAATTVDLSTAGSVQDILDQINNAGAGVTASLNNAGNGIQLTDTTGAATSNLIVSDVTGNTATALNLAHSVAANSINSGGLQLRYISEATQLSSLNGGAGVSLGKFTITDSRGVTATINLTKGGISTVGDVLNAINTSGLDVTASVNSAGNGIQLKDTGPGGVAINAADSGGGSTAADLGIAGTAASPGANLVGSFAKTITVSATDKLGDVVNKINNSGAGVRAQVLNDGSSADPYRLSMTSATGGTAGAFVFDDGGLNFGATNLVTAHNAVLFYGASSVSQGLAINSSSNTFSSIIPGTTITANAVSSTPVQVTVAQDNSAVTTGVNDFITKFNAAIDTLNKYDNFDTTNNTAGQLFGDATTANVRAALYQWISSGNPDLTGTFTSLSQVGITVDSNSHLQLDSNVLSQALQTDRNSVSQLFTYSKTTVNADGTTSVTAAGTGVKIDQLLGNLTDPSTGTLHMASNALDQEIQIDNSQISDLETMLAQKKTVLQNEFNYMEQTLAKLQSQGTALASLSTTLGSTATSSSSTSSTASSSGTGSTSSTLG